MNIPGTGGFAAPFRRVESRGDSSARVCALDRWLARTMLNNIGNPALRMTLWDGQVVSAPGESSAGMVIHDRAALLRLITDPLLHFGDDYCTGLIEIEGGIVTFMETVYKALNKSSKYRRGSDPAAYLRNQPCRNSLQESRQNIHYHYDIGNDFYRLWLDEEMVYTCAYFPEQWASLEAAQIAKMDLVCRKLRLRPGQTVVEAGCGWGALARYMAREYGVSVRAYNISREQIVHARQRAKEEGLEGRVEYVEDDYRNICDSCDAFVSVGMLEHVGPDHYHELGAVIHRSLKDNGIGLIHTIGQNNARPMSSWFLHRIFPGNYPPTISEIMSVFEPGDFTVLDVENLRLHYARTCEKWLERFDMNLHRVQEMFDDFFIRAWRLYLSGCIANFNIGSLQLFQVVFSRSSNNLIPLTRGHLVFPAGGS